MTAANKKVESFYNEYQAHLNKLNTKINDAMTRIDNLRMEISYLQSVEIPKASELRLLTEDATLENRLKRKLEKLQSEYQQKQEDVIILQNAIHNYKVASAEKVKEMEDKILRAEKHGVSKETFDLFLKHKETYLSSLEKDSKPLKELQRIQSLIDTIKSNAGHKIYSEGIQLPYNVDLTVSRAEIVKTVKGI